MNAVVAQHVPDFYQPLVTARLRRIGYAFARRSVPTAPRLIMDGAGVTGLRALLTLDSLQRRRTVFLTRHTHPLYLAAAAWQRVVIIRWSEPDRALLLALGLAGSNIVATDTRRRSLLTPREAGAVLHMLLGCSTMEIADALGISPKTVNAHVSNLMTKHGYRERASLIADALTQYDERTDDA